MGTKKGEKMAKLIPLKEASKLLGSEDKTGRMVRNLWKKGELIGVKIGRRLLIDEDSLEDYINFQIRKQN